MKIAPKHVIFWRKPALLADMEPTIYPTLIPKRDLDGISAVWVWDYFAESDIQ